LTSTPSGITTTGTGTTTTLTGVAPGSYTFSVTVNGCTSSNSLAAVIDAYQPLILDEVINLAYCNNADGSIQVTTTQGIPPYTYNWSNGATTSENNNIGPGTYTINVSDALGCTISETYVLGYLNDTTFLNVQSSYYLITIGQQVNLLATGATSYSWSPPVGLSCVNCSNPIAGPNTTTLYMVIANNSAGCIDTAMVLIEVDQTCNESFLPNVFSPNESGPDVNNTLCVIGNCIETMQLRVYNSWGELVFESNSTEICWDGSYKGKPMNTGVFAYTLYIEQLNGTVIEKSGNITLLR
jgi:gliding motility-associated-like protein